MRGKYLQRTWKYNPTVYAPKRYRVACGYRTFVPEPLSLEDATRDFSVSLAFANTCSEVERMVLNLNQVSDPALRSLSRLLLRTESIASSRVEGMEADARALALAEARRGLGRSVGKQAAEIIANIEAMESAVARAATLEHLSVNDLCEIHEVLMRAQPVGQRPGELRDSQNWIGGNNHNPCGAAFVPPPPERVLPLLENLCVFCDSDHLPPLLQAAIAHAQFETIHPFNDGNGRTGRALIQLLLRRRGLAPQTVPPISVIFSWQRDAYIRGLVAFREGELEDWATTFATATAQAVQLVQRFREEIADLTTYWRDRLREVENPRSDSVTWDLIDELPAFPVVSVQMAAKALGRTVPAINTAFERLERAGVLNRIGTSRRYRVWEPSGLIELIIDLESGGSLSARGNST